MEPVGDGAGGAQPGLLEVIDARETQVLREALVSGHPEHIETVVDGGQVPLLLAVSDNGPQMRSLARARGRHAAPQADHFRPPTAAE